MIALLNNLKKQAELIDEYTPRFFRIYKTEDFFLFKSLLENTKGIFVYDEISSQLKELVKSLNPSVRFSDQLYSEYVKKHLNGFSEYEYGVWVYYPWSNRLVHILDEEEYIQVRTNRNTYKITPEEKSILSTKKVGVIGLSVGQSVALTMAMERSFEEIRLGDFDVIEVSNLNRIRTGIHNVNVKKTIVTAREISEIDPFLKVTCFHDGITNANLNSFIENGGQLDAIIEECDSLDIKINSRYAAKKYGIPVIMDTSDRGMIDIERFDLTPDRPIFHGLLSAFDLSELNAQDTSKRMEMIYAILDMQRISERFRSSIEEIGKSITTWPQLASGVVAGGANAADVYRRLMLGDNLSSGRYYVDIESIIS